MSTLHFVLKWTDDSGQSHGVHTLCLDWQVTGHIHAFIVTVR